MIRMTWPQYLRKECSVGDFKVHLAPQQAEILAIMLMRYPLPTDIVTMVEALWPDPDLQPEQWFNEVRQVIHQLRHKIGAFRIAASGHYRWFELVQVPSDRAVYVTRLRA